MILGGDAENSSKPALLPYSKFLPFHKKGKNRKNFAYKFPFQEKEVTLK